jgi:hypothetical protein
LDAPIPSVSVLTKPSALKIERNSSALNLRKEGAKIRGSRKDAKVSQSAQSKIKMRLHSFECISLRELHLLYFCIPMEYYALRLFLYLTLASLLFIVIGLWRPWAMLWWEDVSNRRKVIKVYGTIAILFYAIYWGIKLIQ